jgi:hypothetical protein
MSNHNFIFFIDSEMILNNTEVMNIFGVGKRLGLILRGVVDA